MGAPTAKANATLSLLISASYANQLMFTNIRVGNMPVLFSAAI